MMTSNKQTRWVGTSVLTAWLGLISLSETGVQALNISLDPASLTTSAGGIVSASVTASGLGNLTAPSIGAFDITVNVDPAILTLSSISFGDPILGDQLGPIFGSFSDFTYDALTGSLNFYSVSLDSPANLDANQPDQFILAVIQFQALTVGSSAIGFGTTVFSDANGDDILPASITGSSVLVNPGGANVPDAGAIPAGLFLAGMILAGRGVRRD